MSDPRAAVLATLRRMVEDGLNTGASGNVSVRREGGFWITCSGRAPEAMTESDIIAMDWEGDWHGPEGRRPSSEWRFHRDILAARPEFGAVVHGHPVSATALAVHGRGIPPFHYMVALAGGDDIRCAPYATFGTQALSDHVIAALAGRRACLLAHHGMVACGRDAESARALAVEIETLAAQYIAASILGEPPRLGPEDMAAVRAKVAAGPGYGSAPGGG